MDGFFVAGWFIVGILAYMLAEATNKSPVKTPAWCVACVLLGPVFLLGIVLMLIHQACMEEL